MLSELTDEMVEAGARGWHALCFSDGRLTVEWHQMSEATRQLFRDDARVVLIAALTIPIGDKT